MKLNRRHFLKASGSGAVLSVLPISLQKVLAQGLQRSSLEGIQHVVILSQENRAFDHYLGTLNGVRGYKDPHPLRKPDGTSVFAQNNSLNKPIWPFRLNNKTTDGQCKVDVTHSWESGLQAWNKGKMNQWISAKDIYSMSYYTREDIPFHYAMSDAFTTCDHYFCSVNTSTSPNRLFLMTGTNGQGLWPGGASMSNDESVPFTWTTYAERLQAAGISWKMYQEKDNFDDNALAWFANFQNAAEGSELFERGMKRGSSDDFANDVANDRLPTVSWIIAPEHLSEHPFSSPPQAGANYSKNLLDALAKNPKVWAKTIFIYTYDENGGIFDHVVPPSPPKGTKNEWTTNAAGELIPLSMGHRIPTWLISSYSMGGSVYSQTCDATSTLRFLERFTGVKEPNISDWRRSLCGDLTEAFNFRKTGFGFPQSLPMAQQALQTDLFCSELPAGLPGAETSQPAVESNQSRELRPLNVQPMLDMQFNAQTKMITLKFLNSGTMASAFDIHSYGVNVFDPLFVTVAEKENKPINLNFATVKTEGFDISVHGPNSFYRRFAGAIINDQPVVNTFINAKTNNFDVYITNPTDKNMEIKVENKITKQATSYLMSPKQMILINPILKDNWYDFKITMKLRSDFSCEYCGHIEGGISRTYPVS